MKRIFSIILILVLVAGTFVGCEGAQSTQQDNVKSIVLTVAETLPSCTAFEYDEAGKPYCFYGYDAEGHAYRVLWNDFVGLNERDQIVVEYDENIKELDYVNPPGGWSPKYEVVATKVKMEKRDNENLVFHIQIKSGDNIIHPAGFLLWSQTDHGDGFVDEMTPDYVEITDRVTRYADAIPTLVLDGDVSYFVQVNGRVDNVYLLTPNEDGYTKSETNFKALSSLEDGTYYVVFEVLLSGNCDPDAPQNSYRYEDVFRLVVPPESQQVQQPNWSDEITMAAGDILAKKLLDDSEKELIKGIFEKDVEWIPDIPECAWSCRFIGGSLDLGYCDCGTISDLNNNRSRKLTEEEKESIVALISNYSKDEEPIFVYDRYMITADGRNYLSEREYELYKKMIDSIIAHNGVVEGFESYDEFFKVWGFMLSEFVPARKMVKTYLNAEEPFSYNDGTATLVFVADKETCDSNYATFENIMNEALSQIRERDSDWERLAKIYLYVSQNMTYGSPYEAYGVYGDFYDCIVYKMGMCTEYAYYLNMLANQIGFETIDGRSLGKDGFTGADHAWSMIQVDGQWYHFDACWQASSFPMETMMYFAFSTEDRYTSLSNNSFWGEPGDLEMFNQDDYTHERGELPYCESSMSEEERMQLYQAVTR